ncbi:hypothetical protein E3N88_24244 [Mikania micrantha]|uniref:Uncharacterized protein n=1 Tax=Mikania micrantha TaxID=192012 RepID=A0A5N6NHC1_9ASTR|nr:hypothetical protein E3N88_24244 [Mikania micrantha]
MSVDHNSSRLCPQARGHPRGSSKGWWVGGWAGCKPDLREEQVKQDDLRERKIGSLRGTYNSYMESLQLARIQDSRLVPVQATSVGHLALIPDVQVKL